ncbi:nitrate/nitrite two-component system sensor histidine kinase NarX [Providencia alcalifaciens]|uniref:nitrate/nitrite two-component system sensor histidine kinase NarX n=1 Tax=Providencia alcalifaciens TaxID=126385 RepID=UPI0004507AD7|nr:nitrate/nitrite two-component system sensor histidine kinase NarX [Providencia alcalifaciens]ETT04410.1 putative nitrate nitrite sensor protein NarX [Providencia alcalifaciens F90-2004]EUC96806.1 putative nitrate nitrite sensor protein NarX [Providencia alcalifaciens PAL-2]MTB31131.1 nitrate/nitrite two-component system sensor histidine kinase NarX [Providencia alcalifaciens]MTC97753.1 nitrate/nitrite two-component system sensor histidine kinase NarX [Providencia alcalifaciens]
MPTLYRRFSIINQVIGLMLLIAVLGIIGMTISNRMIISAQGNAHAINTSGSLRMQSYRLLSLTPINEHNQNYLDALEKDLLSPELTQVVKIENLTPEFDKIHAFWLNTLRPALTRASSPDDARYEVITFVNMLNELVHNIDDITEKKIAYVAMTQLIFISLVFLLLMGTIWHLRRKIYYPWMKLLSMVNAIGRKDFTQRFPMKNNRQDELNALGETLNHMSDELAQSYHQLEERVAEKTADLLAKNRVLSYLYQSNQILHSSETLYLRLQKVLTELKNITQLENLRLKLYEDSNEQYFHEISYASANLDINDKKLASTKSHLSKDNLAEDSQTLQWDLSDNMHRYGVIIGEIKQNQLFSDEKNKLVLMLAKQISGMLTMEQQIEQQQQLLIMDERAAIARELHDSIAQSLSCLKMQISYLQMQPEPLPETTLHLLNEMRTEINTAYSQLRELLTTFRLKLTESGLLPSLKSTLGEFSGRIGFNIQLNYEIPAKSISPHQSIHIIQIIREALSNILKHANATWAKVSLSQNRGTVTITIDDNGSGIDDNPNKLNHYGLIIMRERALSLNGECYITQRAEGGTEVKVTFPLSDI